MPKDHNKKYSNFSNVEKMKNELIPEEFPEGAFGSSINQDEKVSSKSTKWNQGQKRTSAYVYPDEDQHDDLPRQFPGAHPLHDE